MTKSGPGPLLTAATLEMWRAQYRYAARELADCRCDLATLEQRCQVLLQKVADATARGDTYRDAYDSLALEFNRLSQVVAELEAAQEKTPKTRRKTAKKGA